MENEGIWNRLKNQIIRVYKIKLFRHEAKNPPEDQRSDMLT